MLSTPPSIHHITIVLLHSTIRPPLSPVTITQGNTVQVPPCLPIPRQPSISSITTTTHPSPSPHRVAPFSSKPFFFFIGIGKKARDLLFKDYNTDQKFTLTTYSPNGVQYLHDYAGVSASVGLTANPIVNLSGVIGTNVIALGHDLSYDTKTGELTKFNVGLNFTKDDLVASVVLNEKANVLNASYYHVVNPFTKTAVGAEVAHRFSTKENTLTLGTQHALDPLTTVKARFNNFDNNTESTTTCYY